MAGNQHNWVENPNWVDDYYLYKCNLCEVQYLFFTVLDKLT